MARVSLLRAMFYLILALIVCPFGNAAILRVNGPQESIQNVIGQAANGDTVVVSSGVYTQTFNFAGKSLKVTSESGPANTIIIATPSAPPNPVYAIGFSTETRTAVLSGFTIANSVGGIVIQAGASPTISGNIITNCDEGILCFGSPLISSNKITGSKINAMRLIDRPAADVEDNLIEKNNAGVTGNTGGGSVFQRNIFRRNSGSAVAIHFGDMDFVDNQFIENDGHAILVDIGVNERVRVLHNLFLNNGLVGGAAVTFNFGFGTSVIANNIVVGDYGFVCVNGGSNPLPRVSGNNVVSSANHGYTGQLTDLTGQFGNISANPQFLNSSLGDYRLLATSPEIDHGDPANSVNLDFIKTPRPIDGDGDGQALPDIGPFEFSPGPPRPSTTLDAIASPTSVSLTWRPFDLATGYQVLRGTAPDGPFEKITEGNFTSYVDSALTSGGIYFYSVAGVNNFGPGPHSLPIRVRAGNQPPIANLDSITTDEDVPVVFDFLANDSDADGDPLAFEILTLPQHGSTAITNSTVYYVPNANYNGTDGLTYRLSDGYSGVSTGIVSIIVKAVNDPPVVHLNQAQVQSDRLTEIPIQVTDPDNTNFTYVVTQGPSNGVVSISADGGHMFYRSRHLFVGLDSFTFTVSDGTTNTAPLTLPIRVLAPTDLDRDGMADAWETDFDLNNPAGDRDNDGMSNLAEYQAGTSPIDPGSNFQILSVLSDNSGIHLSWRSVGGVRYRILKSIDLSPGSFVEMVRPIGDEVDPAPYGQLSTNTFFDVKGQSGFYSLKVIP